jgi:hypothetical protein
MSWKDHLKRLKNEFENLVGEPQAQNQQHHPPPPGPPPPQQPIGGQQPGHVYWQPQFRPDVPVNQEWDAKIGNGPDGWGNQELQYYTADQQNAFQYVQV